MGVVFLLLLCCLAVGLLGLLVAEGLIQLLLLLKVVLQQLDVVAILLQSLLAAPRDALHLSLKYNHWGRYEEGRRNESWRE
jgi:hypothetical protein